MQSRSGGHATVIGGSASQGHGPGARVASYVMAVSPFKPDMCFLAAGPATYAADEVHKCGEDHGTSLVLSP